MSPKDRPPSPRPAAAGAAERIAAIIEAAEQAAASVIDGAEEQARRCLEEARTKADRIVAERLRAVADELDPPAAERPPARLRPLESPPPAAEAGPAASQRAPDGSAAARLLATQLAVSGASREEIEARLRSGLEIEDASGILDAILGPEG